MWMGLEHSRPLSGTMLVRRFKLKCVAEHGSQISEPSVTHWTDTTLCLRNDTHDNFNPYQLILVNFGRDVAERVHY